MSKSLRILEGSNRAFASRHAIFQATRLEALAGAYRQLATGEFDPEAPENRELPEIAQAVRHELEHQFV